MSVGDLYQIAISTRNLDESVEFYQEKLGLHLIRKFDAPVQLAFFDLGGVRLMIEHGEGDSVFYLQVSDLEEVLNSMRRFDVHIETESHPVYSDTEGHFGSPGETEWMAFVKDPSGNLVGLVERRKSD